MSILIRSMAMPENCIDCFAETYNECMATGKIVNSIGRPDWCPLVEIPPHGRLIDADELMADLKFVDATGEYYTEAQIEYAPTVIEAEGREE